MPNDLRKGRVEANLKGTLAEAAPGPGREVQVAGAEQGSLRWRPPEQGILLAEPGEDATAVGQQQPLHAEVTAHGQEPVLGQLRVREDQTLV